MRNEFLKKYAETHNLDIEHAKVNIALRVHKELAFRFVVSRHCIKSEIQYCDKVLVNHIQDVCDTGILDPEDKDRVRIDFVDEFLSRKYIRRDIRRKK